jgi:hypothetical protein
MSDALVAQLRAQFQEIARRLDAASGGTTPTDRDAIKRDIIALFKRVDGALGELTQLKEEIRGLVDRYKQLSVPPDEPQAHQF